MLGLPLTADPNCTWEMEEGGEFRSIKFGVSQNGVNEGIEVHTISATISPAARSTEN